MAKEKFRLCLLSFTLILQVTSVPAASPVYCGGLYLSAVEEPEAVISQAATYLGARVDEKGLHFFGEATADSVSSIPTVKYSSSDTIMEYSDRAAIADLFAVGTHHPDALDPIMSRFMTDFGIPIMSKKLPNEGNDLRFYLINKMNRRVEDFNYNKLNEIENELQSLGTRKLDDSITFSMQEKVDELYDVLPYSPNRVSFETRYRLVEQAQWLRPSSKYSSHQISMIQGILKVYMRDFGDDWSKAFKATDVMNVWHQRLLQADQTKLSSIIRVLKRDFFQHPQSFVKTVPEDFVEILLSTEDSAHAYFKQSLKKEFELMKQAKQD